MLLCLPCLLAHSSLAKFWYIIHISGPKSLWKREWDSDELSEKPWETEVLKSFESDREPQGPYNSVKIKSQLLKSVNVSIVISLHRKKNSICVYLFLLCLSLWNYPDMWKHFFLSLLSWYLKGINRAAFPPSSIFPLFPHLSC